MYELGLVCIAASLTAGRSRGLIIAISSPIRCKHSNYQRRAKAVSILMCSPKSTTPCDQCLVQGVTIAIARRTPHFHFLWVTSGVKKRVDLQKSLSTGDRLLNLFPCGIKPFPLRWAGLLLRFFEVIQRL
jgi:hypothetical protein